MGIVQLIRVGMAQVQPKEVSTISPPLVDIETIFLNNQCYSDTIGRFGAIFLGRKFSLIFPNIKY